MAKATRIAMVLVAVGAAACGGLSASGQAGSPGKDRSQASEAAIEPYDPPNVVLILTDDQRWDTVSEMPTVMTELAGHGITFGHGYVSNPLCCPSRASILTGQYSHSNGVYTNKARVHGGFAAFDDRSTVATWLDDAGYRTALLGKYLNGYEGTYVPPGWDRWFATYLNGAFYDYLASDDGIERVYGSDPADYGTTVLAHKAVEFIGSTPSDMPLFLYFAPHAPHAPAMAAPGDRRAYPDLRPWRPPAYNEADVSDKPAYIADRPPLDALEAARTDEFRQSQLRSLLALDRAVGQILDALEEGGRLANTLIVFTSDNGYLWGEHRWTSKVVPYEESVRVPFIVRFDPIIHSARTEEQLVLNIDLAPTFAELANVRTRRAEGASLVPLFRDQGGPWRVDFLLEHLQKSSGGVPTYCGVHSDRYVYVRYGTGEEELYDLRRDPAQLTDQVTNERYAETLIQMRKRLWELCDPLPPGYAL
jgi:N-acetylglucosamine-6-sulfatase